MKYFSVQDWKTWEPWDRIQEDKKRYHDYVDTIRHRLPPDLRLLCDFSPEGNPQRVFLNDSQMSQVSASYQAQTVTFVLSGEYTDEQGRQLGLRRFYLNYNGVTEFQIKAGSENAYNSGPDADPQEGILPSSACAPIDLDDHGWNEIEIVEEGLFEHRMLFASGTETAVRFRGFTLDYTDTPHAEATE